MEGLEGDWAAATSLESSTGEAPFGTFLKHWENVEVLCALGGRTTRIGIVKDCRMIEAT